MLRESFFFFRGVLSQNSWLDSLRGFLGGEVARGRLFFSIMFSACRVSKENLRERASSFLEAVISKLEHITDVPNLTLHKILWKRVPFYETLE